MNVNLSPEIEKRVKPSIMRDSTSGCWCPVGNERRSAGRP
jgi:hypothetical protein